MCFEHCAGGVGAKRTSAQSAQDQLGRAGSEEAAKLFNRNIYTRVAKEEAGLSKLDEASSKELLADNNPDRGYNRFWMDPGEDLGKINGQYRSSWIVEPANGQIPFIKNTGAARAAASEEEFADLGSDGPEQRGLPERCIWGFTGGPGPVLRNALYNNKSGQPTEMGRGLRWSLRGQRARC